MHRIENLKKPHSILTIRRPKCVNNLCKRCENYVEIVSFHVESFPFCSSNVSFHIRNVISWEKCCFFCERCSISCERHFISCEKCFISYKKSFISCEKHFISSERCKKLAVSVVVYSGSVGNFSQSFLKFYFVMHDFFFSFWHSRINIVQYIT